MNGYECMAKYMFESKIVDCRLIRLTIDFHQLDQAQMKFLAENCYQSIYNLLEDNFVIQWSWCERNAKENTILEQIRNAPKGFQFSLHGDVRGDVVKDKTTLREYHRRLLRNDPTINISMRQETIPIDYFDFFEECFFENSSQEQLKAAVLKIFNESDKKKMAMWRCHDLQGMFWAHSYRYHPNYYGKYELNIALTSLGPNATSFSEKLASILENIASYLPAISARISLTPFNWPSNQCGHMRYFGGNLVHNTECRRTHKYEAIEWDSYYYFCGAEWYNLLSPLQLTHIPDLQSNAHRFNDVSVQILPSHNAVVKSRKNILETDVAEYRSIKTLLYDALYPGESVMYIKNIFDPYKFGSGMKPRQRWEYVPMFEAEVSVLEDRIVFRHNNTIDSTANT